MTRIVAFFLVLCFFPVVPVQGDADDFGFKPLRRKLRYVEEFYLLYTQNHMASTDSTGRNLMYLKYALQSPFIHPIQALCVIKTREDHRKYRILLRTRINFLLAKGYVQYGYRWDKEEVYYFNQEYAKDLKDSFDIAEAYYKAALKFWEETKRLAALAAADRTRLHGAVIEAIADEAQRIHHGLVRYEKTIRFRLREVERKRRLLRY